MSGAYTGITGLGTLSSTLTVSDGAGVVTLQTGGDIYAYRSGGLTGVLFLNAAGSRYLYNDGTNYQLPGGGLVLGGGFSAAGAITATGDITAFSTSDKRLKTNISQIQDSLNKVNSINGITFDWNEEGQKSRQSEEEVFGNRREAGVIAQEIEEVLPEVVVTRKDGYKAVRYEKLVPLLIEAIKELTAKVEMLESKVEK